MTQTVLLCRIKFVNVFSIESTKLAKVPFLHMHSMHPLKPINSNICLDDFFPYTLIMSC